MISKEKENILATAKANDSLFDLFYRTQENIQFNPAKQDELSTTLDEMNEEYREKVLVEWLQEHGQGEPIESLEKKLETESIPEQSGALNKLLNYFFGGEEPQDSVEFIDRTPYYHYDKGWLYREENNKNVQP